MVDNDALIVLIDVVRMELDDVPRDLPLTAVVFFVVTLARVRT